MSTLLLVSLIGAGFVAVSVFIFMVVKVFLAYRRLQKTERDHELAQQYLESVSYEQEQATKRLQETLNALVQRKQAKAASIANDPASSVKDRLKKAGELTFEQSKIDTRLGHEFVMKHNELELEKLIVLKTILADGFDPIVTIRFNSGDKEMTLSAYVESINKGLA